MHEGEQILITPTTFYWLSLSIRHFLTKHLTNRSILMICGVGKETFIRIQWLSQMNWQTIGSINTDQQTLADLITNAKYSDLLKQHCIKCAKILKID